MLTWTFSSCIVLVFLVSLERSFATTKYINIGAMLSSSKSENIFEQAVLRINHNSTMAINGLHLNTTASILSSNPIRSALDVCDSIITKSVHLLVVGNSLDKPDPPIAISYACGFYNIPIIGITARESIFSDKVCHQNKITIVCLISLNFLFTLNTFYIHAIAISVCTYFCRIFTFVFNVNYPLLLIQI